MILVTGAAGKTGRAIIQALASLDEPVRALVYRDEQVPAIKALGAAEIIVGDLIDRLTIERIVRGVRAIYHICPNMSPDEIMIGRFVIDAAKAFSVEHFVYHSVLHPQTEYMPHHWHKLRLEELLIESGLPFTILQPTAYMQNILAHWQSILEEGIYPVPYSAETQTCLVDLQDVAEVAAKVLSSCKHFGATYELVGTQAISPTAIAEILSDELERPVSVQQIQLDEWEQNARAAGLGEFQIDMLLRMFAYYQEYGFAGNTNVLEWLLDRPSTSLRAFIQRLKI